LAKENFSGTILEKIKKKGESYALFNNGHYRSAGGNLGCHQHTGNGNNRCHCQLASDDSTSPLLGQKKRKMRRKKEEEDFFSPSFSRASFSPDRGEEPAFSAEGEGYQDIGT
jgi:hypothetical protein